jgi:hypothetical protein
MMGRKRLMTGRRVPAHSLGSDTRRATIAEIREGLVVLRENTRAARKTFSAVLTRLNRTKRGYYSPSLAHTIIHHTLSFPKLRAISL